MQSDSEFIKIAVQIDAENHLHKIHRTHSLRTIVHDICTTFGKNNETNKYGLQFQHTKDNKSLQKKYVTEENIAEIKDGYIVSLVGSISYMLNWIFNQREGIILEKLKFLPEMCNDPGVLKEMRKCSYHNLIPRFAIKFKNEELYLSLKSVNNIFNNNFSISMESQFFDFLLHIVKSSNYENKILIISLQLINQILISDYNSSFLLHNLKIDDISPYLWAEDNSDLQLNTLILLNNVVRKSNDKESIVEELHQNKEKIFKYVTDNAKLPQIAHELCVYQTTLLRSLYSKYLYEEVTHEDDYTSILRTKSAIYDPSRRDTMVDFEETEIIRSRFNTYSSDSSADASRLSRCNSREDQLDGISLRSKTFSTDSLLEPIISRISKLTSMCMDYYRKKYEKNFNMSVLETSYCPGFYQVCNQIVNMLCDILYIIKAPTNDAILYIPLIFSGYMRDQFFEELFCRAVWMLARTRREMRAKANDDHEKVLAVLKEQFAISLHKRPMKFKQLTDEIKKITYKEVFDIWEKERNASWDDMIQNSPCLQTVREQLLPGIVQLIKQQRMEVLKRGEVFPKLPEKKGKQLYWFISLNKNNTKLQYSDFDPETGNFTSAKTEFHISKIEHIATGKASRCVKENKVRRQELIPRCFTLLFDNDEPLDFLASDESTAQYWIDGLYLLLGKPVESAHYKHDLDMLLKMDLNIRLLDLQNVPVPKSPPPIPPSPLGYGIAEQFADSQVLLSPLASPVPIRVKPAVPPKSEQLRQTIALRRTTSNNLID